MPKPKDPPDFQSPELWLIRACLALALGLSAFLAWNSFQGGGVPGCGPESGCDKVLSSRWAYVFGFPVSLFAAPIYLALLILVRRPKVRWLPVAGMAFLVLFSALWFVSLQTFVLRAFCKFCMTAHAAGSFAALMLLRRVRLPMPRLMASLSSACIAVCVLGVAQIFGRQPAPKQILAAHPTPGLAMPSAGSPTFTFMEGMFTLDLTTVPLSGPANASKKVAKLFDYTCHHCRTLHHLLTDFQAKHSNELAVISLPLPLDSNCNRLVKNTLPAHLNGCEYARLGLAVFQVNHSKFEAYSDWIYAPEHPPELERARAFARDLVGAVALDNALQSPVINRQIQSDVNIYLEAYRRAHSGQLPQLYFAEGASIGAVESQQQLEKIMNENLGFPLSSTP